MNSGSASRPCLQPIQSGTVTSLEQSGTVMGTWSSTNNSQALTDLGTVRSRYSTNRSESMTVGHS